MFYQSPIWRYINEKIYDKPFFYLKINWQEYQAIIKQKSIFGFKLNWYQILGVQSTDVWTDLPYLRSIVLPQLPYKHGNILIQFWFTDIILSDLTNNIKKFTPEQIHAFEDLLSKQSDLLLSQGRKQSVKKNLPEADIIINTTNDIDTLWSDISSNTKNHINKADKKWVIFDTIKDQDDLDRFVQLYRWVWSNKWFGVISSDLIYKLYDYMKTTRSGEIFVVRYEGKIVGGALCIFDQQNLVYLYGGNDTTIGNIWASQYLHWQIIKYAHEHGFTTYDMLGASRMGQQDWLSNVTQFKSWFGWTKYEYLWSFDMIISPILYKIYKRFW